jgi:hypothetical protein
MTSFTMTVTEAGNTLPCYKARNCITRHDPRIKKPKRMPLVHKTMQALLWDAEGCIFFEYVPQEETINVIHYLHHSRVLSCTAWKMYTEGKNLSCHMAAFSCMSLTCARTEFRRIVRNFFYNHLKYCTWLSGTSTCLSSYSIRWETSTMRPIRQSRKPSIVVYKLLKWNYTKREF